MKYLLTIIGEEADREDDVSPEQMQAMMDPWNEYNRQVLDAGAFVAGEGLLPSSSATTVKLDEGGRPTVTDGRSPRPRSSSAASTCSSAPTWTRRSSGPRRSPRARARSIEVWPAMDFTQFGYADPYAEAAGAR